jgi:hypothetical protein
MAEGGASYGNAAKSDARAQLAALPAVHEGIAECSLTFLTAG